MNERGESVPSKPEIVNEIRRQLSRGGGLGGHEINEQVEAIDWATREELENQRDFYQRKLDEVVAHLSSEPHYSRLGNYFYFHPAGRCHRHYRVR